MVRNIAYLIQLVLYKMKNADNESTFLFQTLLSTLQEKEIKLGSRTIR